MDLLGPRGPQDPLNILALRPCSNYTFLHDPIYKLLGGNHWCFGRLKRLDNERAWASVSRASERKSQGRNLKSRASIWKISHQFQNKGRNEKGKIFENDLKFDLWMRKWWGVSYQDFLIPRSKPDRSTTFTTTSWKFQNWPQSQSIRDWKTYFPITYGLPIRD